MGEPRPEKVAVVAEVREKFADSEGAVLTEYRGLDVPSMAELRRSLRDAGGEYKIYKNSLVRFAVQELGLEIEDLLVGPTAIAFVGEKADGSPGDAAAVAKALKEFARTNDNLVLKGGVLDDKILSVEELRALADLPPRDMLLAQLAGAFQAPLSKLAGLLQALPRDFAYGLQALIDKQGGAPAPADETGGDDTEAVTEEAETGDTEAVTDEAETGDTDTTESPEASSGDVDEHDATDEVDEEQDQES